MLMKKDSLFEKRQSLEKAFHDMQKGESKVNLDHLELCRENLQILYEKVSSLDKKMSEVSECLDIFSLKSIVFKDSEKAFAAKIYQKEISENVGGIVKAAPLFKKDCLVEDVEGKSWWDTLSSNIKPKVSVSLENLRGKSRPGSGAEHPTRSNDDASEGTH